MGLCVSCDAAAAASTTAKVIFPDGELHEHSGGISVRVSRALLHKNFSPPSAFILCSADDLDDEGRVAALDDSEELEPGQIYFVLPAHMLKRRLMPAEMAKLAVRAARAITDAGVVIAPGNPYDSLDEGEKKRKNKTTPEGSKRDQRSGSRRGTNLASDLTAIPE